MFGNSRKLEIWIIEDETDLCEMLTLSFRSQGHCVVQFSRADSFLETFNSGKTSDIVITDIRFPIGLNGKELLKTIKERNPFTPPVIIITAYEDYSVRTLYDEGAESIFVKPFNLQEIDSAINRLTLPIKNRFSLSVEEFTLHFSNYVRTIDTKEIIDYDFGRGGLCIRSSQKLNINEFVNFTINMREIDNYKPEITGIIRWYNPIKPQPEYGIEIINVNPPDLFLDLLEKTLPVAYIPKGIRNHKTKEK